MLISECCAPCSTTAIPVQVPGSQGAAGDAGIDGQSAFTLTVGNFNVPAASGTNVTVNVGSSLWMVVGQVVVVDGPATFRVVSLPDPSSVVLKWLQGANDVAANALVTSGAKVSPGGEPASASGLANPVTIATGGTSATTKAGAQTALGLGQDAVVSTVTGLTQSITTSAVQVGSIAVTIPAAGSYMLRGNVAVDITGATFASSRTVTAKIRNTTQGTDLSTLTIHTGITSTATFPTCQWVIAEVQNATVVASDIIQILVSIDTVPSAGTIQVISGNLVAVPTRKT